MEPGGSAQELQQSGTIELSMAEDSIDDMFSGCNTTMNTRVQNEFFPREIQSNPSFQGGWTRCAEKTSSNGLTSNHTRALCVYTSNYPKVYEHLNGALRSGAANYSTESFEYHSLYFWLISAVQTINKSCEITYRRTPDAYSGKINQKMRFGYFASSSRNANHRGFGRETCFHIKTCSGAYIKPYSTYPGEEEVLIPPYEVFRVTDIVSNSYQELNNCNKIFVLEHVEDKSTLNCKAVNHSQHIRANLTLILGVQVLIVLLWNNSIQLFN